MKYDLPRRIFLLKKYYEFSSIKAIQRAFCVKFKGKIAPSYSVIKNIVSVFEKTGSVSPMPPKHKAPSQKREQTKIKLETMVNEFPNLSIRKAASAVGVSPTLIYHVLHDDMHLKPYKYQTWHKLEVHDHEPRLKFAQWFLAKPPATKNFFIFSD